MRANEFRPVEKLVKLRKSKPPPAVQKRKPSGYDASSYFLFLALAFAGDFFFADFGGFLLAAARFGFEVIFLVADLALF